jgi:deazaflavin-dependent oxidoreductase (nitroreductase family)
MPLISNRIRARVTMLLPDAGVRLSGRLQKAAYRVSGGRIGGSFAGEPVLLITTTGRRSGQQRTTPVLYGLHGDDPIVIGSNTGSDHPPAWALNLLADPEAVIQIRGERRLVRARVAEGEERAMLWGRMNAAYSGFDTYEARTDRDIRVFVLEPR